ncbi:MAG TPA: DNA-binding protein [Myxococcota bacterium]|nr:DNA-binding protein [Myxococcota bacterium]
MGTVLQVLVSHGVRASEEEVARAMEIALVESGFRLPYPDPRKELNAEQVELLERGGFELDRLEFGLEDPIARTAFEYAVLRATALTTQQAAKRLGVNDSRVRQRLSERALYGIKVGDEWRLLVFQFARKGLVPGIERVFPVLPKSLNPVAVYRWFHMPNPDLEEREGQGRALTPLQWLQSGNDPDVVAELAAGL